MQLNWEQFEKPQEFGTEYRAWGVSVPYRILVTADWVVVEQFGTGREPVRGRRIAGPGGAFAVASAIAQTWEDGQQHTVNALGIKVAAR